MLKMDLRKELKELYSTPAGDVVSVEAPELNYLMVSGEGDPNVSQSYKEAIEALYSVSYTLKFMIKKGEKAVDYKVMPLEGLWWADDMQDFVRGNKQNWKWTAMIMQPEFVNEELLGIAIDEVKRKKDPSGLSRIRFEAFAEGSSAQILHIGPYSEEAPTIRRLHEFIESMGRELRGKHHEIYLSDPRRSAPDKLKTIIRQPYI